MLVSREYKKKKDANKKMSLKFSITQQIASLNWKSLLSWSAAGGVLALGSKLLIDTMVPSETCANLQKDHPWLLLDSEVLGTLNELWVLAEGNLISFKDVKQVCLLFEELLLIQRSTKAQHDVLDADLTLASRAFCVEGKIKQVVAQLGEILPVNPSLREDLINHTQSLFEAATEISSDCVTSHKNVLYGLNDA